MTKNKDKNKIIDIDSYEAVLDKNTRSIRYYAISGEQRIEMPEAFKEMYTEDYLAITRTRSQRPEMHGIETEEYYIPLRTSS